MSSIGSILSIARTAISANQTAMQVTSHNIANAQTEGYTRQVAQFAARSPLQLPYGSLGTGVDITNVVRLRDQMLDATFRNETADATAFSYRADLLGSVESIVNEPSDTGLSSALDAFWNAWSDLANNPGNASAQNVVRQRGADLAAMFNSMSGQIDNLVSATRTQLGTDVSQLNQQLQAIASLNQQIMSAESGGIQAPDLRDARDKLADQLAQSGLARSEPQSNGSLSVYVGGIEVVGGNVAKTLEVRGGTTLSLGIVGQADPLPTPSGSIGARLDFVNVDAARLHGQLDTMAKAIVNGVNEYHASGWTASGDALGGANWDPLLGPTGSRVDFFDAGGTSAATMSLSAAVQADATVVAAGDVQGAPGNNSVALALASLRDGTGMQQLEARMGAAYSTQIGLPSGRSYGDYYGQVVSDLGVETSVANRQRDVHATMADNVDQRRLGVSGVSLDEELTKMMQFQQAYVAATRIVKAVEDMTQSLINMV